MNLTNSNIEAPNNQAAVVEKFKVFPATTRIVPNDKITKVLFKLSDEAYSYHLQGYEMKILEGKKRQVGTIESSLTISARPNTPNSRLTEFDKAVLSTCISAQEYGSKLITVAQILRALTGKKSNSSNHEIYKNQYVAIMTCLRKLIFTKLTADLSAVNKYFGYTCADKISRPLLPALLVPLKVNGQQVADVVLFSGESPLMTIARSRRQVLNYDASLLDVPWLRNTPLVVALKNCIIDRVVEINLHYKTFKPILTFADIFQKCGVATTSRKATHDARGTISKVFQHLQTVGFISAFEMTKQNGAFYSINFRFKKRETT